MVEDESLFLGNSSNLSFENSSVTIYGHLEKECYSRIVEVHGKYKTIERPNYNILTITLNDLIKSKDYEFYQIVLIDCENNEVDNSHTSYTIQNGQNNFAKTPKYIFLENKETLLNFLECIYINITAADKDFPLHVFDVLWFFDCGKVVKYSSSNPNDVDFTVGFLCRYKEKESVEKEKEYLDEVILKVTKLARAKMLDFLFEIVHTYGMEKQMLFYISSDKDN